ncbi:small GTP-binding protein, putative [Trichomonas vaginalis G3]|uniref:Small GTP-binding protein, putative n=2 Tax=Trichomonas vaginalis TaxID=5722 RepID=A0A8U0WPB5_TRIV3|nr:small Rab GTPase Rab1c [Trichomonas vaginalis G3]AAX97450.1 small Rab GTPase Rab1c [Trichomonas vaginalis]EAY01285.1 small GTP-binding protein, putative [Trichomonas vaginalis G3]KAI5542813.1 small Rab GTPase Rab1c [Trichomonas vaginalis G3]|eukprot:XP_001314092.1 small GTP-binding protein [Trichomonas vaginalis G3]
MSTQDYDYLFKVIIIGDSGVGKSNILLRYTDDLFSNQFISTIGVDFRIHTIDVDDKKVKMQIWDTEGQERFLAITRSYFGYSHVALIVYDKTNKESFEKVSFWMNELDQKCDKNLLRVIVGNKADLKELEYITEEQGKNLANQYGCLFAETSAKEDIGIDEVFLLCAQTLVKRGINSNPLPIQIVSLPPGQKVGTCC